MEGKKNKPEIRFAGFTDSWEQRKFDKLIKTFIVPMRDKPKKFGGNIPWTRIEDIEGKYLRNTKSNQYVTRETINRMNLKIIPKGSLIVSISASFGIIAIIEQDLITNQTFIGLVPEETINIEFLYYLCNSKNFLHQLKQKSAGSTIFYITKIDVMTINTQLPIIKEQIRLASFLNNLDNLITLHQRKCDKLKIIKKSLLEKMFPKECENVPELRFKNFTEDWEQRKLDEIATFSKGRGYSKNDLRKEGSPIILYGSLYTKYKSVLKDSDTYANPKVQSVISTGEEVLVPASGETAKDIARASAVIKSGILLGGDLNIIFPQRILNSIFLAITISNGEQQINLSKLAQGKSVVHIHNSNLKQLNIVYPYLKEQLSIISLITSLDNLITLHQRKLEKLKKIKKSLLEKMFV
jgi:type I restriction enzyme S subunit